MNRLLLSFALLTFLLLPTQGWGAIAHVQSANQDNTFNTTCVVSLTGTSAGNALILSIIGNSQTDVVTSVSGTNTYTQSNFGGASSTGIWHYYALNIAGGNETVTVTVSAGKSLNCALHEYSGVATSSALDQHNVTVSGAGSTSTDGDVTPSVTTTTDGQLIFASIIDISGTVTWAAGTGYTARQTGLAGGTYHHMTEDKAQVSAGAIQGTFTADTTSNYHAAISTFKAAGAAAAPTFYRKRLQ